MITTWCSLTDTPVESGPLRVVPGSHRDGLLTHCNDYEGNGPEFRGRQIPERLFENDEAVPLPTRRGDVVFLHKQLVHGSLANVSDNTMVLVTDGSADDRHSQIVCWEVFFRRFDSDMLHRV